MSVGVGLRVGTTVSSVAVTSAVPGQPGPAPIERRSAVHLHQDGTATLGEIDPVLDQGASSFTHFLEHVGNQAGIRAADGSLSRAEDLVATAMECLLADAAPLIGDREYTVVATHPTDWAPSTIAVLRNALDYVGLRHVSLVSDAEAAAAWFESQVSRQTGRLVAVYHIDDHGSTVTLVRAGIAAGKPVRFGIADAPPVTKQLSTALAGFGWQMANLDAVVVTTDENVDTAAAQLVAQSVKAGLGTRCALAPDPHQTMVRGAALAAAAGSVEYLGSTQIIPTTRTSLPRKQTPQGNGSAPRLVDPDATTVIPKVAPREPHRAMPTAQPPKTDRTTASTARAGDVATIAPDEDSTARRPSPILLAICAAAVVLLAVVGVLVLTQRDSAAETNTSVADQRVTATIPELQSPRPTPAKTSTTTTTTSAPPTSSEAESTTTEPAAPVVAPVDDSTATAEPAETTTSRQAEAVTTTTVPQTTTTRPAPGWQTTEEKPTRSRDRDTPTPTTTRQTPTPTTTQSEPGGSPGSGPGSPSTPPGNDS
ncbi:hypothetical protein ACWDUD_04225 [Rhodococcus sp. NPDC003382]|uniref:hypothetical protein n=1 Tax=unclassified Rhodococcus (in: high G+C Gram-positive bacteria) TaxID=192944 RepID=UPI0018CE46C2|nr:MULTISPECIES: hypothetical protein [unclassified Rhodococcus (in: high G+C Gram-positive bacteria)]MBH0118694.1 hypothetical protein [Rhodococcus sp. CX]MCK8671892.1 hypothetical protein [Rhodococcus sp. HM1]